MKDLLGDAAGGVTVANLLEGAGGTQDNIRNPKSQFLPFLPLLNTPSFQWIKHDRQDWCRNVRIDGKTVALRSERGTEEYCRGNVEMKKGEEHFFSLLFHTATLPPDRGYIIYGITTDLTGYYHHKGVSHFMYNGGMDKRENNSQKGVLEGKWGEIVREGSVLEVKVEVTESGAAVRFRHSHYAHSQWTLLSPNWPLHPSSSCFFFLHAYDGAQMDVELLEHSMKKI